MKKETITEQKQTDSTEKVKAKKIGVIELVTYTKNLPHLIQNRKFENYKILTLKDIFQKLWRRIKRK